MIGYIIDMYISYLIYAQEKGTTPLHVAAKAGQVSQAELLVVYGADPGAEDSQAKTPIDYARCDSEFFQMKHYGNIFVFES
jgi:hypothetical protein